MAKKKGKSTWVYTNPRTMETYRFRKLKSGTIKTDAFLGWTSAEGKLIKAKR